MGPFGNLVKHLTWLQYQASPQSARLLLNVRQALFGLPFLHPELCRHLLARQQGFNGVHAMHGIQPPRSHGSCTRNTSTFAAARLILSSGIPGFAGALFTAALMITLHDF
ncbi:hypothetical protein GCM10010082_03620 [Kushneria pakistanensis]|uniref:Uncharacterized protein n=1 Tax=Kushneria pakistanensis TaxID=1508770 RepID=A0ABQ3FAP3_9GAMM|nr:hypothetical protein GCM10010082_03620 [Kushneria pakistanensis]